MPFFSSFTGSFAGGRRKPISIGGGGGGGGAADFTSLTLAYSADNPNAYNTGQYDNFGQGLAIGSSYAIVGASSEDDASGNNSGKAYVYDLSDGTLTYTLDNPNPAASAQLGYSVAINDTYAIASAWLANSGSGKVYVFNLSDGSLARTIDNPNTYSTSDNDYFGRSAAANDTYLVVGADGEDDAGGSGSGKAYVFDLSDGSLVYTLDNPNDYGSSANDGFGDTVAISDSYVMVGSYFAADANGVDSGVAYVFNLSDGTLRYTFQNPNAYGTADVDRFGDSIAITDTYAIVGVPQEDDADGSGSGKAYIFDLSDGSLAYTLDNPNPDGDAVNDKFGQEVAINDTYALVTAIWEDDTNGTSSGKVYVYDLSDGSLVNTILNPNDYGTSTDDQFGWKIATTNSHVIISANAEDVNGLNSGIAYIFQGS